jgi:hypothetical protein
MKQENFVYVGDEVRLYEDDPDDIKGKWICYQTGDVVSVTESTADVDFGDVIIRYQTSKLKSITVYYDHRILVPSASGVVVTNFTTGEFST